VVNYKVNKAGLVDSIGAVGEKNILDRIPFFGGSYTKVDKKEEFFIRLNRVNILFTVFAAKKGLSII
jgi:hypothetical protein